MKNEKRSNEHCSEFIKFMPVSPCVGDVSSAVAREARGTRSRIRLKAEAQLAFVGPTTIYAFMQAMGLVNVTPKAA